MASTKNEPVARSSKRKVNCTRPVILPDLRPATIQAVLESHPYQRFPVVTGGEIRGIANRADLAASLAGNVAPRLARPVICSSDIRVREVGTLLMDSTSGMVLIRDDPAGAIKAVVTLHDLLRAQAALAE